MIPSVRVIEDGELRVVIEAVFGYEGSGATVRYAISRVAPQIDLDIRIINRTKRRRSSCVCRRRCPIRFRLWRPRSARSRCTGGGARRSGRSS